MPADASLAAIDTREAVLLKVTTSRCPGCHRPCRAEVWKSGPPPGRVYFRKDCRTAGCADHRVSWSLLSSDARFYWLARGKAENASSCGAGGDCACSGVTGSLGKNAAGRKEGPFEKLSTCLALIEIVDSCNLACPTCYADSPVGVARKLVASSLEDIQRRIQGVIDRKGPIEILQLSGGEPTLHPHFFELLHWVFDNRDIDYVLINTNGVRIAGDPAFCNQLARSVRRGRIQLYLQFDGPQEAGQRSLRGADLREQKLRAIARAGEAGLPLTLAMTVVPENLSFLWETVAFALPRSHIRGVSFQPLFGSGRLPGRLGEAESAGGRVTAERLNTADVITGLIEQSAGRLTVEDFTPLPCGDPNCSIIGYLIKGKNGEVRSISEFLDFRNVQGFLRDKIRYRIEDLQACGCESEPLGRILKDLEIDETKSFRLFIKPFMDATSWDEDRIDRCCTHVIRPDGKLDSFCRYYSGFEDCSSAP